MRTCSICGSVFEPFVADIADYEYGVPWDSMLLKCASCGLVTQEPPVRSDQIATLYPDNYLAHTPASGSRSIYGSLKRILAERGARSVARHIPKGGSLIEIGCGNGAFLRTLQSVRGDIEIAGVDIRDTHIEGLDKFTFYEGQLEQVDTQGRRFDVLYCSNLVEHVPDPILFLQKCRAIIKPGGMIYGITPDHLSLDRYIFGKFWAGYHYPRHTFVFNHDNLAALLVQVGYQNVKIKGSYGFWYLSLANVFLHLPGTKKRGLAFAAVTALFLPLDLLINTFRCQGSMTFLSRRPLD